MGWWYVPLAEGTEIPKVLHQDHVDNFFRLSRHSAQRICTREKNSKCRILLRSNGWPPEVHSRVRPAAFCCWDFFLLHDNAPTHKAASVWPQKIIRVETESGGTRRRTGGEVKGKEANGVGSQQSSAWLGTVHPVLLRSFSADPHSKKASTRLNWHPRQYKWTRPFRWKTESGFCACAVTFRLHSTPLYQLPPPSALQIYLRQTIFCSPSWKWS